MAKINILEEVLKHDQDEVVEYLADEAKVVRATLRNAIKNNTPELAYSTLVDVEILTNILIELDRRNKVHTLK
jgi:hypothetical protein